MPNKPDQKAMLVLVYLFLCFTILFGAGWIFFSRRPVDFAILLTGNVLLFAVSFYSFRLGIKALYHQQVQVFLRLVYSSLLLKLFLLAIAAFIYIAWYKAGINKPALFGCFGLYIIYTFTEVRLVVKQQRKQKDV